MAYATGNYNVVRNGEVQKGRFLQVFRNMKIVPGKYLSTSGISWKIKIKHMKKHFDTNV